MKTDTATMPHATPDPDVEANNPNPRTPERDVESEVESILDGDEGDEGDAELDDC